MAGKPNRRTVLGTTIGAVSATTAAAASGRIAVHSPNGLLRVAVLVANGRLRYEVVRRGRVLVASSGLGLDLAGKPSLTGGLVVESVEHRTIDESWRPVWGPDSLVRNHARECVLRTVQPTSGLRLDLIVRVFDDGVGFRYHLPAQAGLDTYTVTAERHELVPGGGNRLEHRRTALPGRHGCPTCAPRRPRSRRPLWMVSTSWCTRRR